MERPAFSFADSLAGNPIIAAVKEPEGLDRALDSDCGVIFLLCGDICTIGPLAARVSGRGKALFIHADLVDGLAGREVAVDFIRENTGAAGIISTKPSLIRRAREVGLSTVQRFFLIDSLALHNVRRLLAPEQRQFRPDVVEILPGAMPKVLRQLAAFSPVPVIAGGLIHDKEDVIAALDAGAAAISSTDPAIWFL